MAKNHLQVEGRQPAPQMQKLLQEGWGIPRHSRVWEPPTDMFENKNGLIVQVEIAGMHEDDLYIAVNSRTLVIGGVREDPESKQAYYQMEIRYGEFRTEIQLPWAADADQIEATYEAGFLRILIPRPSVHRVPVTWGNENSEGQD